MKRNNKYNLNELSNKEIFELISTRSIGRLPSDFWDKEMVIEATKWIIEEKYKCSDEDIKSNLWSKIFTQYRLTGPIYKYYNGIYDLINEIYPNRFKPWELNTVPNNFWNKNTLKEFTIWMIEEKYKWSDEDIKNKLSLNTYREYSIGNQIYEYYDSMYDLINATYPNRFKPWEMKNCPISTWNKETIIEATKWMIEEKLQWTEEDIKDKLDIYVFNEYKLNIQVHNYFNNIYDLINEIYPNKFKPWELKNSPINTWNKENIIKSTKWVIEELQWTEEDIKNKLTLNVLRKHIKSNLKQIYKYFDSLYDLINEIYPNRFKPWELKRVSPEFWTKETIIEATKWMIEEKLQWNEEDIKNKLTLNVLKKYKINVDYFYKYFNSIYDLINEIYPNRFHRDDFDRRLKKNRINKG